jgi:hypothetical protein
LGKEQGILATLDGRISRDGRMVREVFNLDTGGRNGESKECTADKGLEGRMDIWCSLIVQSRWLAIQSRGLTSSTSLIIPTRLSLLHHHPKPCLLEPIHTLRKYSSTPLMALSVPGTRSLSLSTLNQMMRERPSKKHPYAWSDDTKSERDHLHPLKPKRKRPRDFGYPLVPSTLDSLRMETRPSGKSQSPINSTKSLPMF